MKRFVNVHRKAFLGVILHVFFLFFFAHGASASEPVSSAVRVTQGTGAISFLFTNGILAAGFLVLSWFLFKRS